MPVESDQPAGWYDETGQWIPNMNAGAPPPPPDQPTPPPEPAPSEPSSGGGTWKPDFTQSDPWAGMPKDYEGIATFVPTPSNPTPPWEQPAKSGTTEAAAPADIPKYGTEEYRERAFEVAEKQLKPYMTGQNIDVEAVVKAGKVEYLRGVGVDEKTVKEIQDYAEKRGKPSKEEKEQSEALDKIKKYRADDGTYDLVGAIRSGHIADVRRAGFSDVDIVEAQSLAAMRPVVARAMENLGPYTASDGAVDGAKYLRYHPEDAATLRTAGFDNKTIDDWKQWADRPAVRANAIDRYDELLAQAGVKPIPATLDTVLDKYSDTRLGELAISQGYDTRGIKEYRQALKDNPELAKARQEMLAAVRKSGKEKPDLSLEGFTEEYVSVRGDTPAMRDQAALVYKSLYGTRAAVVSSGERFTADYIFAPARALYPEVDTKDITLREWGMGVVQVSLLVAPGAAAIGGRAGKAIMAGTEGTAAGLMTAGIVKDWNKMEPSERALSIGIDTLVLASAVNRVVPLKKLIPRGEATVKTPKTPKVDPATTQQTVSKALVKLGGNKPDVDAALTQIREGIQRNDRAMLQAGARRLELVSGQVPKQLGGRALEDYSKNLLKNPDEYLKLGKGEGLKAADLERVNEGLAANKKHLDMIDRQLEKTKSGNLKRQLETERQKVQKIVKTQEKTKLAAREKVIMPEEQGKSVPATRTTTALTVRGKPAPRPSKATTALVVRRKEALATMRGKAAPPRTKTATSREAAKSKPRERTYRDLEAPGYQPSREYRYVPVSQPLPQTLTATKTKTFPYPETKTKEQTKPAPMTAPYPYPETKTQPAPATKTKPETSTQPQPKPDTKTKPGPEMPMPTPGQTETSTKRSPKWPRREGEGQERPWGERDIASAVAWRQGAFVWAVKEPYQAGDWKAYTPHNLPEGLHISKDIHEARKTIQLYKGTKGPRYISRDIGIVFADIRSPARQPGRAGALSFRVDRRDTGRRPAPRLKARVSRDIYSRNGQISHVKRKNSKRVSRGGVVR